MEYAVVRTGGKQYRVGKGDILDVDKLSASKNGTIDLGEVLLLVSDNNVKVGTPIVRGIKVKAKVLDQIKGEKIYVRKFKAKSRYRRVLGFRALLTKIKIEKIEG